MKTLTWCDVWEDDPLLCCDVWDDVDAADECGWCVLVPLWLRLASVTTYCCGTDLTLSRRGLGFRYCSSLPPTAAAATTTPPRDDCDDADVDAEV